MGSVLLVSVLVGLAIIGGLILFIIPGIYIGVRLCVSIEALVGVLLYLDLRARKESLTLETLRTDLQASAA